MIAMMITITTAPQAPPIAAYTTMLLLVTSPDVVIRSVVVGVYTYSALTTVTPVKAHDSQ